MPAMNPKYIINEVTKAMQESEGTPIYLSNKNQIHPKEYLVNYLDKTYNIWIYIWTLTHGGRSNLPNEYRIQMTTVSSPLKFNPNGITVLMGYYPDLNVFAGFDINKHCRFKQGSPSIQVGLPTLHEALQNGLSFTKKGNDEIVIGIRSDHFLDYCLNAEKLHYYGIENCDILQKAVLLDTELQKDIKALTEDRKVIIKNISKISRKATFKKIVINAYDYRCAITRMQLKLVDAAHILPVTSDKSSDHISNGIALSPTFHRAYDHGLIYFDENYNIQINKERLKDLRELNLIGGLNTFTVFLNQKIHLPRDINQRPRIEYIKLANKYRCIPGYS